MRLDYTTACPDWKRRIVEKESLIPFKPLFPEVADACMEVFCNLRIPDVYGQPRIGDAAPQWMIDLARAIFGSYDPTTGIRHIEEWFLLIAKKNGKSSFAAAVMLTTLITNWRPGNLFLILSPTKEIADNSFKPALDMVMIDEALKSQIHPQPNFRTLTFRETGASLKVVAADADTVGGTKAAGLLVDELHLFGRKANAGSMLREAKGGFVSKPEALFIGLSTQSDDAPSGVFEQTLRYMRKVRDGEIVDRKKCAVLYEFPEEMIRDKSFKDPTNWHIPNPSVGVSVRLEKLIDSFREAEEAGKGELANFYAKHLNVEVGMGRSQDGWAAAELWEQGADTSLTLDEILRVSDIVTLGIDGGGLDDLLGIVVLGRHAVTGSWLAWGHAIISPIGMERRKANGVHYQKFIQDGDLTVADLPDDLLALQAIIARVNDSGKLAIVGVDPSCVSGIPEVCAELGITQENDRLEGVRQGYGLMKPLAEIPRRLADGTFKHCNQPLVGWCVDNAKIKQTTTSVQMARDEAGYGKIDVAVALLNAAYLMAGNPTNKSDLGILVAGI